MSASFRAAPVCSRTVPIRAPRMMTMPMELKVPEKPAPMTPAISPRGIPARRARIRETLMMDRKGWTLYLEIATIIITIARTNAIIRGKPVMIESSSHFLSRLHRKCTSRLCSVVHYIKGFPKKLQWYGGRKKQGIFVPGDKNCQKVSSPSPRLRSRYSSMARYSEGA